MLTLHRSEYHPTPLLRAIQLVLLVLIVVGVYLLVTRDSWVPQLVESIVSSEARSYDPLNTTYIVDGEAVRLTGGVMTREVAPGSASVETFRVFGEPSYGDIDTDGDDDAVLLLTRDGGGSGTFFYATVAVNLDGQYTGTDAILLGDRIAPQNFAVRNGIGEVNYADRLPGESFSVQPSMGKTLWVKVDPAKLRLMQIAVDFEGEADPEVMTLEMQTWTWVGTAYGDGTESSPETPEEFTLMFEDGKFSANTDCNAVGGGYTSSGNAIVFTRIISTKMYCEGSQEGEFSAMLQDTESFSFTSKGELIFTLKSGGTSTFR
jgi:heat shock protein HslJ